MRIDLPGKGSRTLLAELDAAKVPYEMMKPKPGVVLNAGEVVAIAEAVPWASIAAVLVAWLRARAKRRLSITVDGKKVIDATGYSVEEVERMLPRSTQVIVVDMQPEESA